MANISRNRTQTLTPQGLEKDRVGEGYHPPPTHPSALIFAIPLLSESFEQAMICGECLSLTTVVCLNWELSI